MSVSTGACCAALLQQQQQTIQHHEDHCDQVVGHCDKPVNHNAIRDKATIAADHALSKQCTVVEHGRVVVKKMLPKDSTGAA